MSCCPVTWGENGLSETTRNGVTIEQTNISGDLIFRGSPGFADAERVLSCLSSANMPTMCLHQLYSASTNYLHQKDSPYEYLTIFFPGKGLDEETNSVHLQSYLTTKHEYPITRWPIIGVKFLSTGTLVTMCSDETSLCIRRYTRQSNLKRKLSFVFANQQQSVFLILFEKSVEIPICWSLIRLLPPNLPDGCALSPKTRVC